MGFEFEFDEKNNVLRGNIKDPPEKIRLSDEIMKLLIKRRTSLADGLDALNTVMLTAIEATHGREKANEYDLLNAWFPEEVRRFSGGGFSSLLGRAGWRANTARAAPAPPAQPLPQHAQDLPIRRRRSDCGSPLGYAPPAARKFRV